MADDKVKHGASTPGPAPASASGKPDPLTVREARVDTQAPASPRHASTARYHVRVLLALRRIIRAVDLHSRKLLAQHKITGPQLVCLLSIAEHERMTASAIGRHVHLSPSTVIGVLDRLEAKKLIRRDRDVRDRRLVHISLTGQGKALVGNAPSPLQDRLAEAMLNLPEVELAMIAASLERIVDMMDVKHIDAAPILETGPIDPTTG